MRLGVRVSLADSSNELLKTQPARNTGCVYWICPYVTTSNSTGYVGQTIVALSQRLRCHLTPKNGCFGIANAIKRHGRENFTIQTLEINIPRRKLNEREMYWIKKLDTWKSGYNCGPGGRVSTMADPGVQMRHLIATKKGHNTPEYLEGARARGIAQARRPGDSEYRSNRAKAQHSDPIKKKRHSEGLSRGWIKRRANGNYKPPRVKMTKEERSAAVALGWVKRRERAKNC